MNTSRPSVLGPHDEQSPAPVSSDLLHNGGPPTLFLFGIRTVGGEITFDVYGVLV